MSFHRNLKYHWVITVTTIKWEAAIGDVESLSIETNQFWFFARVSKADTSLCTSVVGFP